MVADAVQITIFDSERCGYRWKIPAGVSCCEPGLVLLGLMYGTFVPYDPHLCAIDPRPQYCIVDVYFYKKAGRLNVFS
jgi:hypothetical protein